MSNESVIELLKLLAPSGATALVGAILAYRSPQLVKELFAGIGTLLVTIEKIGRAREHRKRAAGVDRGNSPSRSSDENPTRQCGGAHA